jgi:SAUR family protein
MGIISGNHNHHYLSFHLHIPRFNFHHHHEKKNDIPKGYLAVMVGQREEQQRFVIPLFYVNHPLFKQLWKKAEEEYGFKNKGVITIPCKIEDFHKVQQSIDIEKPRHHHHAWCFKV